MFVVDASITLSWCFDDESTDRTDQVLVRLLEEGGVVPAHWPLEVANALRTAALSGLVDPHALLRAHEIVRQLPIEIRPVGIATALGLVEPAIQHGLTAYDEAYVTLADALGLGIATLDERLANACRAVGVPLIE